MSASRSRRHSSRVRPGSCFAFAPGTRRSGRAAGQQVRAGDQQVPLAALRPRPGPDRRLVGAGHGRGDDQRPDQRVHVPDRSRGAGKERVDEPVRGAGARQGLQDAGAPPGRGRLAGPAARARPGREQRPRVIGIITPGQVRARHPGQLPRPLPAPAAPAAPQARRPGRPARRSGPPAPRSARPGPRPARRSQHRAAARCWPAVIPGPARHEGEHPHRSANVTSTRIN